jgi:hypothetical protein
MDDTVTEGPLYEARKHEPSAAPPLANSIHHNL